MLSLTRKKGESLLLWIKGRKVRVQILSVEPKRIRLTIAAPKEIPIIRVDSNSLSKKRQ